MKAKLISRSIVASRYPHQGHCVHTFACQSTNSSVDIVVTDHGSNSFPNLDPEDEIEVEIIFKIKPKSEEKTIKLW